MTNLNIHKRQDYTKDWVIRGSMKVPGILETPGFIKTIPVVVDHRKVQKMIESKNDMFDAFYYDKKLKVKLTSYDTDKRTHEVTFFSLKVVEEKTLLESALPIRLEGYCIGVVNGGVLVKMKDRLKVLGTPQELPDYVIADIHELDIGDKITVGDLTERVGDDLRIKADSEEVIAVCHPPSPIVPKVGNPSRFFRLRNKLRKTA